MSITQDRPTDIYDALITTRAQLAGALDVIDVALEHHLRPAAGQIGLAGARRLQALFDVFDAPEPFQRMALLSIEKTELAELTPIEANDFAHRAVERFGFKEPE